jgi:hypothetical protein
MFEYYNKFKFIQIHSNSFKFIQIFGSPTPAHHNSTVEYAPFKLYEKR